MTSDQAKKLCVGLLVLVVLWITVRSITSTVDQVEAVKAEAAAVEKKVEAAKIEKEKKMAEEAPVDALEALNVKKAVPLKADPIPLIKGPDLFKPFNPKEGNPFPSPPNFLPNSSDKHKAIELQKQSNIARAESEWEIENWRAETQQKIYTLKREENRLTQSMWDHRNIPKKYRELGIERDEISKQILDLNNDLRKRTNLKRIEVETKKSHIREDIRKLNKYGFPY